MSCGNRGSERLGKLPRSPSTCEGRSRIWIQNQHSLWLSTLPLSVGGPRSYQQHITWLETNNNNKQTKKHITTTSGGFQYANPTEDGYLEKPGVNFVPDTLYVSGRKWWLVITESWQEEVGGWAEGTGGICWWAAVTFKSSRKGFGWLLGSTVIAKFFFGGGIELLVQGF